MRRFLTKEEVRKLIEAAGSTGRYPHRDRTMVLLAYRKGMRASECCFLEWSSVSFEDGTIYVERLKNGNASVQVLAQDEVDALQQLQRQSVGRFVFVNERGRPVSRQGFHRIVARAGEQAGLSIKTWSHQLRHSAGVHMTAAGISSFIVQDMLGHKDPMMTRHYCRLAAGRYEQAAKALA